MTEQSVSWYYKKQYYPTDEDAINALIRDYPNVGLSRLMDLAKSEILVVYEADVITEAADENNIE